MTSTREPYKESQAMRSSPTSPDVMLGTVRRGRPWLAQTKPAARPSGHIFQQVRKTTVLLGPSVTAGLKPDTKDPGNLASRELLRPESGCVWTPVHSPLSIQPGRAGQDSQPVTLPLEGPGYSGRTSNFPRDLGQLTDAPETCSFV